MTGKKKVLEEIFQEEEIQYLTKIVETGLFLTGVTVWVATVAIVSMKNSELFSSIGIVIGLLIIVLAFGLNMFRRWNQ